MKTVLLVEQDVGLIFWLAETLVSAGYEALPAKSPLDAASLVNEQNLSVDVLVINPALEDAAGFVRALRGFRKNLKVIALLESSDAHLNSLLRVDASHSKPEVIDEFSRLEWLHVIEDVLVGSTTII